MKHDPHPNRRLSDCDQWRDVHKYVAKSAKSGNPASVPSRRGGVEVQPVSKNYSVYLMWDVVLTTHLPRNPGMKVLEVGSAPGKILLRYRDYFGYQPYGVDYSEEGVELNRALFRAYGLPEEQIIQADFLSREFQDRYAGGFDVVASHGFIEHFENPGDIVQNHIDLIMPGGYLVVSIPNFAKFNGRVLGVVDRKQLDIHNLDIMNGRRFAELFEGRDLEDLYCGYTGTLNLSMFHNCDNNWRTSVARGLNQVQRGVNVLGKAVLRGRGLESPTFSPYLIYVGRKKA